MTKYKKYFFIFCLISAAYSAYPQQHKTDSLKKLAASAANDTTRIIRLCDLSFALSENNPAESINIAKQALALAEKIGDNNNQAFALMNLGTAYRNYSNYEQALHCFSRSKNIYKTIGASDKVLLVSENEAIVYWNRGELDKAIKLNLEVLKLAEQKNYPKMQIMALNNTGLAFSDKREYKKAINYFEKAIDVSRKIALSDSSNEYQNIGMCYYFMKDLKKAEYYLMTALAIFSYDNNSKGKMWVLTNLGNLRLEDGKPEAALAYYKESLAISESLNDKVQMASVLGNIAYIYSDLGDHKSAYASCEKALAISNGLNSNKITENLYYVYSDICAAAKDHSGAYQNLLKSWSLRDSIFNDERDRSVREMETKYETEKKDSQIKLLHSEKEKQIIITAAIVASLVLVIFFFIVLYNRFRVIRQQKQLIELQKKEVETQKHLVEEKQKDILDSIHYARRIQNSLLPTHKYIAKNLKHLKN